MDRNGPVSDGGSKSMYCSPAADRPDTRTVLAAGIFTVEEMLATASTPVPLTRSDSIRPTGTPRTDTSWLASSPPESGSAIVIW